MVLLQISQKLSVLSQLTLIKAKLSELNKKQPFKFCIYDNACHLSSSVNNHNHDDLRHISFFIDRFHINNHSNEKCKTTHNLFNKSELKDINSQVCEQKNYDYNKIKHNTKHMTKNHFMLFMLSMTDHLNMKTMKKIQCEHKKQQSFSIYGSDV